MYREAHRKLTLRNLLRLARFFALVPLLRLLRQGPRSTLIWMVVRLRLLLFGVPTLRYARITPQLYVGGQFRRKGWQKLQSAGITAVVNMRSERDDLGKYLPLSYEHYLHVPTIDDTPVALDNLQRGADWIAERIRAGEVVYVHCAVGSGRGPSMGAAYLIKHCGMTTDEALATIRRTRPFVMPVSSQVERLREFEALVRDGQRAASGFGEQQGGATRS